MKIKVTAHIHSQQYSCDEKPEFIFFSCKLEDTDYRTYVGEQEVEIEVPDNYDPRAQKIAALEKQKQKITADFQKSMNDIQRRIMELQAIEFVA